MECTRCQTVAPEGAKFCMSCGNALTPACPQCGTELPPEARFCLNCGHQMAQSPTPVETPAGGGLEQYIPKELLNKLEAARASGGIQGERRVVTMLFCDVTGSTAAAEKLDPEEWAQIMNGAFEHLIAPVYQYEGTLARLMGDAILAFFGAPIAHEDDPQRAVLAGLEISNSIRPYREEVKERWGVDFEVRVGINTGLVVVGEVGSDLRVEYTALGDAINVAARMEQAAAPGTVLISADTYRAVAPLFDFEGQQFFEVKGKSEPVGAYRVLAAKAEPGRERGIEGLGSPMIGRELEVESLKSLISSLSEGRGQIVSVMGDAGLGKSRLIAELRHSVLSDGQFELGWCEGRSRSYETDTPFTPFISLFSGYFEFSPDDSDEGKYQRIGGKLSQVMPDTMARSAPFFATMLGVDIPGEDGDHLKYLQPPQIREKIFAAIKDLVEREASHRPLVLVFEDVHWGDPTSLDLLETLMALADRVPLMILGVFRPVRQDPGWRFHETATRDYVHRYTTVSLEPLGEEDARTLVANLLEIEDLPQQVRSLIMTKAEGNPFFVEEVIRSLLDAQLVVRQDGHWRATQEIANIVLPDTLAGVITARLDRLSEDSKRVAQTAAVIGRDFAAGTLQEIYENLPALDDALTDLQRRELIREKSRSPHLQYMYKHILTQEAAYASLLLSRRREIHLRIAECLEKNNPDQVYEIARHFRDAQESARAAPYLVDAGDRAAREYSTPEAINYYTAALKILAEIKEPPLARRAYEGLGGALTLGGDISGAVENYHDMFHAAQDYEDQPMQVSALNKLGFVTALIQGQFPEAEAHLSESETLARQCGDMPGLAELHMTYCFMTVPFGNFDNAIEHLEEASKIGSELELEEPRLFGLTHTANTLTYMTEFEQAHKATQEALTLAESLGNHKWRSEILGFSNAIYQLRNGDLNSAAESAQTAADLAARIGAGTQEGLAELSLGQICWLRGEYQEARGHYERALEAGRTSGPPFIQVSALCGLGTVHLDISGTLADKTKQYHTEALAIMELPLGTATGAMAWAELGFSSLALGDPQQATDYFQKGLEVPTALMFLARPLLLVGSAFVALGGGDVSGAATLMDTAREFAEQREMRHLYPLLSLAEANLNLARENAAGALDSFNRAEQLALEMDMKPWAWQARGGAAQVLAGLGRQDEANAKRSEALATINEIANQFRDDQLGALYPADAAKKLG